MNARLDLDPRWSPYARAEAEALAARPTPGAQGGWPSRVGLAIAALLVWGTLFAHVNPSFGFLFSREMGEAAHRWPWEFFKTESGWDLRWTPVTAWVLSLGLAGLALLVAVFLRPGRARAALALLAFALLTGTLLQPDKSLSIMSGLNVALALLAGGVIAASARPRPDGARRAVGFAALTLALLLALPLAPQNSDPDAPGAPAPTSAGYVSEASRAINLYVGLLNPRADEQRPKPSTTEVVGLAFYPPLLALLGLLVGLLSLLGLGGRWAPTAIGLLLLATVVGPAASGALIAVDAEARMRGLEGNLPSSEQFQFLATGAAEGIAVLLRLSLLPLALGVADVLRARRS